MSVVPQGLRFAEGLRWPPCDPRGTGALKTLDPQQWCVCRGGSEQGRWHVHRQEGKGVPSCQRRARAPGVWREFVCAGKHSLPPE